MAARRCLPLVRHFSTSSVGAQMVKPPIQVYGFGGRYATALYSAASKQKALDQVDKDLGSVESLMKKSAAMADFMTNPTISKKAKISVISDVLKGEKMSDSTVNFFSMLAENGRLNKVKDIFVAWRKIMAAHRGEIVCNVTTAKALDSSQQKQVQEALKAFVKKGESLQLNLNVDPALIGGMIVEVGDKYVDMSTASKVRNLTNLIKEAA
ncbi:ATP synthase subunit O, mitochondrial-like [Lytechinus variegatus]|uniref:ATP synthase subunit O, mitochondrial-like n=1 Tax=Lytechinus variegatus TaxID=7654 RepID=UPI001BB1160F|nr:ATP synthase subunit O, mitochondrial-like [Lytechinus variegatus]XP_041462347.1 ATP synthase subunit O, mitochondrial-like [Lytechinus variegatus]